LVQGNLRAQPFDERHTLIGINADFVRNAVAKCPNHQIVSPTRILERVRLCISGQIADAVTWPNGDSLFAVDQRAASRHDHKNLFLKKVAMPSRRLAPWAHGLNDQADCLTPEIAADVGHFPLDRSTVIATDWFEIANIKLSKWHGRILLTDCATAPTDLDRASKSATFEPQAARQTGMLLWQDGRVASRKETLVSECSFERDCAAATAGRSRA
jgi:hypothetical protein